MKIRNCQLILLFVIFLSAKAIASFNHPGLLHSKADLVRIREMVAGEVEPYLSGYKVFKSDPASQLDYRICGPYDEVGRYPNVWSREYDSDANACYQLALMWVITGEQGYADKAREMIVSWAGKLKRVSGRDAVLMAGLGPFKMINAAEILRYTDSGWSDSDSKLTERMFLKVIYPVVKDFALFANGNWDAAAIQTVMAIGVFCDDRAIFERGLRYYVNGAGNGAIAHYIINDEGQCQESGRDQQHTQLGQALLAACCEIAWQQGLDLYGYDDNRLLKGFEYTARYNLGESVPFAGMIDCTGKYSHKRISDKGRGQLRAIYEMVYNHYVRRMGLTADNIEKAAMAVRPEGAGHPGSDHVGFGTLLFTRDGGRGKVTVPAEPGGVIVKGAGGEIKLAWIAAAGAEKYIVKRAGKPEGPYKVIAGDIVKTEYVDHDANDGVIYYYRVAAVNGSSCSGESCTSGGCVSVPAGWKKSGGEVSCDGREFVITAGGKDIVSDNDGCSLIYMPMKGDGVITARYVPQLSCQFSSFGLTMRNAVGEEAGYAGLLVTPRFDGSVETPGWFGRLFCQPTEIDKPESIASVKLGESSVSNGRLTGYCWLRLARKGNIVTASVSYDGQDWIEVGKTAAILDEELFVGVVVCAGHDDMTTTIKFDHVEVSN